jgi:hypothetical protein
MSETFVLRALYRTCAGMVETAFSGKLAEWLVTERPAYHAFDKEVAAAAK